MAMKQKQLERELRKAGVSKKKSGRVADRLLGKTKTDKAKPKKRLGRLRKHAPHLKLKRGKGKKK
jgi:hypothetical protein